MIFPVSFALGLILIQLSRVLSFKMGIVSRKRNDRWNASACIPRFAGPAILLPALLFMSPGEAAVLSGFCLIGAVDDLISLNPVAKALLLLIPAFGAACVSGSVLTGVMCWCFANSYNLLDHADGLAGSVAFIVLVFSGHSGGTALAGACAAFLCFNFPPARTYMGDSGSLTLGAAVVLLTHSAFGTVNLLWINLIPVADTLFVVVRRLAEGRKPWIGGTDHTGHALLRYGLHPACVTALYGSITLLLVLVFR